MHELAKALFINRIDKKRLYIVLISIVFIIGLFLFIEIGFRLAGFRYEPWDLKRNIFIKDEISGAMVTNPKYAGLFVYPQRFILNKAPDMLRVIMIGASSIVPLQEARHLKERLSILTGLNSEKIEIINMGFLSCGSDRMIISTQEAVKYRPDVVMIYSGHSEFISFSKPENLNRYTRFALHSRLIQLLVKKVIEHLSPEEIPFFHVYMPEYKRLDREYIYEDYRENLSDILEEITESGAVPVIGTLAFNRHAVDLPSSEGRKEILQSIANIEIHGEQISLNAEGIINSIDESHRYAAIAMQLYDAERYSESKLFYDLALEMQCSPISATRITNRIVRNVADKYSAELTDMEEILDSISQQGIPGYEYFDDHCHLNEEGQIVLMSAFAESINKALSKHL